MNQREGAAARMASALAADSKCLACAHKSLRTPRATCAAKPIANSAGNCLSMKPSQITEEMYARIPALLEQGMTKTAIAEMCGVKLSTLKVFCSRRGISLRKGGPRKLVPRKLMLPLSNHVLKSLREAARSLGKDSTERLVSDLLEKIVSDDLYKAVLDEEATPHPVTPAPQSDPPSCPRPNRWTRQDFSTARRWSTIRTAASPQARRPPP